MFNLRRLLFNFPSKVQSVNLCLSMWSHKPEMLHLTWLFYPFITDFHLQRYGWQVATQKLVNSSGFMFFYWSSVVVGGQPNFKWFLSVSSSFSRNSLLNIFFRLWRIRISLNTLKMNFLLDLLLEGFFARQKILSYSP